MLADRTERGVGLALIGLAIVLLFTSKLMRLADYDIFLHLAVGESILDQHEIPRTGLFSATRGDAAWVDNEWGFQVLVAEVHRVAGVKGLILLKSFLPALAACVLGVAMHRRGAPHAAVAAAIALTDLGLGLVNLRPQLVTYVFLMVFLLGLSDLEAGRTRAPVVYLPIAAAVWANMHGGFIVGLVALAIPASVEVARHIAGRPPTLPLKPLVAALVLSAGAAFLNPYGWRQVVYPITYALHPGMTAFNSEWQPTTLVNGPGLSVVFSVAVVVFALSPLRPALRDLSVALAFAGFSFKAWRHVGLAAYVVPWTLAPSARAWIDEALPKNSLRRRVLFPAGVGLFMLVGFVYASELPKESPFHFDRDVALPVQTANFFAEHRPPGTLFNQYEWGGYLIYLLKPESVVFVDGRNDLYGEEFMADYFRITAAAPGSEEILARYGVGSAMLAYERSNARLIAKLLDEGWVCVHRSIERTPVVLLVKRSDASNALIEEFGMPLSPPQPGHVP
jgi:hypothetical protein